MNDGFFWGSSKDKKKENKTKVISGDDDNSSIEVTGNHVYFYSGVDFESSLGINKTLQEVSVKALNNANTWGFDNPRIHLHINSGGGFIHAGTAIMDTVYNLTKKLEVYTYVEGRAASAATFFSVVGTKRFITPNSHMLIHQLSAGMWGKYSEMEDDKKNMDMMMDMIRNVYRNYTKVPMKEIDEILSHDLYWTAEKCLEMGMVDEIL